METLLSTHNPRIHTVTTRDKSNGDIEVVTQLCIECSSDDDDKMLLLAIQGSVIKKMIVVEKEKTCTWMNWLSSFFIRSGPPPSAHNLRVCSVVTRVNGHGITEAFVQLCYDIKHGDYMVLSLQGSFITKINGVLIMARITQEKKRFATFVHELVIKSPADRLKSPPPKPEMRRSVLERGTPCIIV